jgi:type IV pilus assembly protein PilV
VYSDNNGFTLIEFLVAIVIIMVGLLGLLQTVNIGLQYNHENQFRQEATMLADEQISLAKLIPYNDLATDATAVSRKVYNGYANYSVTRTVSEVGASSAITKSIDVSISWKFKGKRYTHAVYSLITQGN